jgi:hypothetical protein
VRKHGCPKAGKSSKMSERGLLNGVKCPQSFLGEILQILSFISHFTSFLASNLAFEPHPYPQKRIVSLIPQHLPLNQ